MVAVVVSRTEVAAADLRGAAARAADPKVARRALAVAMVLDGRSRSDAAKASAKDRQTLRDWVHRFNADGLAGLSDRPPPGRPSSLSAEQKKQLAGWVEAGPELQQDGVIRWRRVDLRDRIKDRFNVTLDVRSVGGCCVSWISVGCRSARSIRRRNRRRRRLLKKLQRPGVPGGCRAGVRSAGRDLVREPALGLDPRDEARVGQQGTLTRIWAKRGTRPRAVRDHRFTWAYLFGAICPARGTGAAVIMPEVNVEAMNEHLAEISRCVSVGAIAVLVLDGAGWHNSPRIEVPDNIVLLALPPYSPELNPVENIWQYLRSNHLSHRVFVRPHVRSMRTGPDQRSDPRPAQGWRCARRHQSG